MVIRSEGAVEYVMVGVSRRPTQAIWRGKEIEPVQYYLQVPYVKGQKRQLRDRPQREVIKLDAEVKESKKQVGERVIKSFPYSIVNEINTQGFTPRSFRKTTSTSLGLRHEGGEQSLKTRGIGEDPEGK
ncbi:hypothetical protein TNCV_4625791 [Trichonephila clavipes]|nr:hypothetical protein TNCV_4625791 [Trichonephila clavipes]